MLGVAAVGTAAVLYRAQAAAAARARLKDGSYHVEPTRSGGGV